MSGLVLVSTRLIRQAPVAGHAPVPPLHAVARAGAAALLAVLPSPACHRSRCTIAPPLLRVSTKAILLPSSDSTGEVCTVPVVALPEPSKFVL